MFLAKNEFFNLKKIFGFVYLGGDIGVPQDTDGSTPPRWSQEGSDRIFRPWLGWLAGQSATVRVRVHCCIVPDILLDMYITFVNPSLNLCVSLPVYNYSIKNNFTFECVNLLSICIPGKIKTKMKKKLKQRSLYNQKQKTHQAVNCCNSLLILHFMQICTVYPSIEQRSL